MERFALDRSGFVATPVGTDERFARYTFWRDLDRFTQEYIEALLRELAERLPGLATRRTPSEVAAFHKLAPETLEMIFKDCKAFRRQYILPHYDGGEFWRDRQSGEIPARFFPPLTAYAGDDGRLYLREAP